MSRCEPGKLDLDLDDEVSRDALADCLASGWTAAEIAEELGLDGAYDVARWCAYHELPLPRVAESLPPPPAPTVGVKERASKQVSKAAKKIDGQRHTKRGKGGRFAKNRQGRKEAKGRKGAKARPQIADEDVVRCYERCLTIKAAAREMDTTEYYIGLALKRCGVELDREAAIWTAAHASRELQAPRGITLARRCELLAAAHSALAAVHATPQEIKSIMIAPVSEMVWAARQSKHKGDSK